MNRIEIDGVVQRSPFSGTTKNGNPYQSFTIMNVDRSSMKEYKTYVDVQDWSAAVPVSVGDTVHVIGSLRASSYEDKETKKTVWKLKVNALSVTRFDEHVPPASATIEDSFTESDIPF